MLCSLDKLLSVSFAHFFIHAYYLLVRSASGLSMLEGCLRWTHEAVGEVVVLSTAVNIRCDNIQHDTVARIRVRLPA